jgi:ABC-type lipoprotein release transport system permease subunit
MRLVISGMLIGVAAAFALRRLVSGLLYGVTVTDPLTIGGTLLLLLIVALIACWLPARRAVKIDPLVTLRYE